MSTWLVDHCHARIMSQSLLVPGKNYVCTRLPIHETSGEKICFQFSTLNTTPATLCPSFTQSSLFIVIKSDLDPSMDAALEVGGGSSCQVRRVKSTLQYLTYMIWVQRYTHTRLSTLFLYVIHLRLWLYKGCLAYYV